MYLVGITSNGNVHFYGERVTKKLGYAFGSTSRDEFLALEKKLAVRAPPSRSPSAPDRAGAFVVVHRQGATKRLEPAGALMDEIDRVAATKAWVEVEGPKGYGRGDPVPAAALEAMLGKQLQALDTCAAAKTQIALNVEITAFGGLQITNAAGKKEADGVCIGKVVKGFKLPLGAAGVAPVTLTIGK